MLTNICSWCNLHSSLTNHKGRLAYCSRRIWNSRNRSFSSLIGLITSCCTRRATHTANHGNALWVFVATWAWRGVAIWAWRGVATWAWRVPPPDMQCSGIVAAEGFQGLFFTGQIVSRDDTRWSRWYTSRQMIHVGALLGISWCQCKRQNPSKSSIYKYRREVLEILHSTQPTFSTNLLDHPSWQSFLTHLLDQPSRPTFSTNKMRFILAIAAVLSALTITTATHVSCQAGLSDTNDCEKHYCHCNGDILTCQAGTTCAGSCECAAWSPQYEFLNRIRVNWVPQR